VCQVEGDRRLITPGAVAPRRCAASPNSTSPQHCTQSIPKCQREPSPLLLTLVSPYSRWSRWSQPLTPSLDLMGAGVPVRCVCETGRNAAAARFLFFYSCLWRWAPGSKTTLRFQNPERAGRCERAGELCVVRGFNLLNKPEKSRCRVLALAPQFNEYSKQYWHLYPHPTHQPARVKGVARVKMSTGERPVLPLTFCRQRPSYKSTAELT
jgi:hypothetical protein